MLRAQSQKDLYKKHHNTADGRIRVWFGIRQIMNSTDRLLLETRDITRELQTGIHMVLNSARFSCVYVFFHSCIWVTIYEDICAMNGPCTLISFEDV